jgi:hypothetical protein
MTQKASSEYVVELDGTTHRWTTDGLSPMDGPGPDHPSGDRWLVTDMQRSIARFMTVEAPAKYADVVVNKKLQETGEFDEPVAIITHWKQKRGKNTTDIFFTALPSQLHQNYLDQLTEADDCVMVVPLYACLYAVLKHFKSKDTMAVVFQHDRYAELLVGSLKRVHYASRCTAFDTSDEQIRNLWDTVCVTIQTVEEEMGKKVARLCVIGGFDGNNPEQADHFGPDRDDSEEIAPEPDDYRTEQFSFARALTLLGGSDSASPPIEKAYYYARRLAPYLWSAFLIAFLVTGGAYFAFEIKSNRLAGEIETLQNQVNNTRFQPTVKIPGGDYRASLKFLSELAGAQQIPSYKQMINDISNAVFSDMIVKVLKIDYAGGEIRLEIFGSIQAPFDQAHKGYRQFLDTIAQRGYTVVESRFDTNINESNIILKLKRSIT